MKKTVTLHLRDWKNRRQNATYKVLDTRQEVNFEPFYTKLTN